MGCGRLGEAVELWPWRRSRRAVAVVGEAVVEDVGAEDIGPWPWRRGHRAVAVEARPSSFSFSRGRRIRRDLAVEAKPSRRGRGDVAIEL